MKRLALALLLFATPATAGPPGPTVADLAWMAGEWIQVGETRTVRETWSSPLDGVMAGLGETHRPGRPVSLEVMTITTEPSGVTFTARLEGQPPTPFPLKAGGPDEVVFENLAHDFPQRVIYRRCGEDLCASIEGMVGGELKGVAWRYRRVR